jgi:hypothetical protein
MVIRREYKRPLHASLRLDREEIMRSQLTRICAILTAPSLRALLGVLLLSACGSKDIPENWRYITLPTAGFVRVGDATDENGLYLEYQGVSREELFRQVSAALIAAGYSIHGEAFHGTVVGFERGESRLAMKIDQLDELYVAIFNEHGKEPLLHGVVFGRYILGPEVTGEKARQMLLEDLGKSSDKEKR